MATPYSVQPISFVFVDAGDAVDQFLYGTEDRVQPSGLALEDAPKKNTNRFGDEQNSREEKGNLKPTITGHLELLRFQ